MSYRPNTNDDRVCRHAAGPPGPLSGLRVLDLSAYIAGPYGCSLLADQGAEVIKVEPPVGDNLRKYPSTLEAESRAFVGVNRSKRGMVLDLKQPDATWPRCWRWCAGRRAGAQLPAQRAARGWASRYAQLTPINPRLIYCAVTGYGETGPAARTRPATTRCCRP